MKTPVSCALLLVVLLLSACGTYSKHVVGLTPEEMEKEKANKDDLWEENKKLKAKNEKILSTDKAVLSKSKQLITDYKALQGEQARLQERVQSLENQIAETDERAGDTERKGALPGKGRVKIKVLSSNGDLETARAAARKLEALGYPASKTDLVQRKYDGTKVYYAETFEPQARDIASGLGGGPVKLQPLTWHSVFDIIVVTDTLH
jgi:hypothetical protein